MRNWKQFCGSARKKKRIPHRNTHFLNYTHKEVLRMLLQDEQYVVKWLSQYGALPKTQIIRMLQKPEQTAEKILRNLKKQMQIADVSGGYYIGLDSMCRPDQRVILAVWVLLKFIDYVDPMAHYPAVYPSQLFFLKENIGYEIVVLYEGGAKSVKAFAAAGGFEIYHCCPPYRNGGKTYVMPDDSPKVCAHYYCSVSGTDDRTEVYVVPKKDFPLWLAAERAMPDEGVKLYEKQKI